MKTGNMRGYVNTNNVTRVEIIDHRPCVECNGHGQLPNGNSCNDCGGLGVPGRSVVCYNYDVIVDVQLQDDDRTLKIFLHERE